MPTVFGSYKTHFTRVSLKCNRSTRRRDEASHCGGCDVEREERDCDDDYKAGGELHKLNKEREYPPLHITIIFWIHPVRNFHNV